MCNLSTGAFPLLLPIDMEPSSRLHQLRSVWVPTGLGIQRNPETDLLLLTDRLRIGKWLQQIDCGILNDTPVAAAVLASKAATQENPRLRMLHADPFDHATLLRGGEGIRPEAESPQCQTSEPGTPKGMRTPDAVAAKAVARVKETQSPCSVQVRSSPGTVRLI